MPLDVIEQAIKLTKSSVKRYQAMVDSLNYLNDSGTDLQGDIVECGVWQGGNIILARAMCPDRICWLYDTYCGMTPPDPIDGASACNRYKVKELSGRKWDAVPLQLVRDNFASFGLLDDKYLRFVEGDVGSTLLQEKNLPDKIALLRLDTDWYRSTKIELEVLYPRLVPNGILIVDDYGHWAGCRKAVDDYFNGRLEAKPIDYTAIMVVKH